MKFNFGTIVVVYPNGLDSRLIGVVVKCWECFKNGKMTYNYDVYVRSWNSVDNFEENRLEYFEYDKEIEHD